MTDPLEPETPLPDNAFRIENSRLTETERHANQNQVPLPRETKDNDLAFPSENAGIVGEDLNVRLGVPLEE